MPARPTFTLNGRPAALRLMDSRLVAAGAFLFVFGLVVVSVGYALEVGITPTQRSFNTDLANQFYGGVAALGLGGFLVAVGIGTAIFGLMRGVAGFPGMGAKPAGTQVEPAQQPAAAGFCTHCGAARSGDAPFCHKCGNKY